MPTTNDDKLSVRYWITPNWAWANQGPTEFAPVSGKPAVINYKRTGLPRFIYAFIGGEAGTLKRNRWDGFDWDWQDEGFPQASSGQPSTMVGSPGAVTYANPGGSGPHRIDVFVRGQSSGTNPVINLFTRHRIGASWFWDDLGRPSGTSGVYGTPGVISYFDNSNFPRLYVFVRGSDGGLHLKFKKSSGWNWRNQGKPTGAFISGSPAVVTYRTNGWITQQIHAFIGSTTGRLYRNYWNGSQWQWQNLGKPTGSTVVGSPGAVSYSGGLGSANKLHVFMRGFDGNLYMNYFDGTSWTWSNRGKPTGTSVANGSTPSVTTYKGSDGLRRIHVFVRGADGELYVYRKKGSSWLWAPQGVPQG